MIKFFRSYNPLNIIWLVVLLCVLRVGYLYSLPAKTDFPFDELFSRLHLSAAYRYNIPPALNLLIAAILVLAQALLLNFLVNYHNLLGKSTYLPAVMYVTASGLLTPFLLLGPPLVCNFLVIWMLFKIFSFYKGEDAKSTSYDLGMIVAVGTLFYLPFIFMFMCVWIALVIFRPFKWREWVACIIGFATVFFFLAVSYYLGGSMQQFYDIWLPLATKFQFKISFNYYNYLVLIPVIIILVLGFFKLQQNFLKSYVQTRKSMQLLLFVAVIGGFSFYIRPGFHADHFLLCAVPAAIFFSYYFLYGSYRWFYESLYIILLASIIYFQFNTF
ncbi:MAG: beta-carotene 15,15'-monooxygenase [Bacteroidetes bacterium]|nr:beta-carotene 15,15'-monooxygenase [Bacteroidota bacterium]